MTNETNNKTLNPTNLKQELKSFMGDHLRYQCPHKRKVIYTPGVRHLAEKAEAYWLIDAIAGWIDSPEFTKAAMKDARIVDLHFWTLEVGAHRSAVLLAKADSPCEPFVEQHIEWTDFPLAKIDIWAGFDGSHWTLYLPSEH